MKDLWQYLKETDKPIVFYGMGNGADKIYRILNRLGKQPDGVFATDGFVRPKTVYGKVLTTLSETEKQFKDFIVLLCFGSSRDDVIENVKLISEKHELYAPDVPVYGDSLFDKSFYEDNKSRLDSVYGMLYDEQSRKTFLNTVNYKLSGDINFLFDCETDEKEPFDTFFKLSGSEIYVDLGAYRGDTVESFIKTVNGYKKIYAVEPDKKNYAKLLNYCNSLQNTVCINACVSDKCGKIPFAMNSSRGSFASGTGVLTDAVTVDSLTNGTATFIKFDVEGAEVSAVEGAKETILSSKPKMMISCYHRSEDLFEIVEKVISIRNDYKIYMRHTGGLPAWDTYFYFI